MGQHSRIHSESPQSLSQLDLMPAAVEREELTRIRAAYARRRQIIPRGRYDRIDPYNLCRFQEREYAMASLFRAVGLRSLVGLRILDIGCGRGDILRQLLDYGAEPALLFGIDLLEENVVEAVRLAPHLHIVCGNAARLPFPDSTFDLIVQVTLFTSILNENVKRTIATEMRRVLVPQGKVLWYDFTFNNPKNADVRGIRKAEIKRLFPGFGITFRRITLAPPLGRIVAPLSPLLYFILAQVRVLSTHCACLLEKS